jgi:DNA-binding transcriptional regulator LsrR (DeoR family)
LSSRKLLLPLHLSQYFSTTITPSPTSKKASRVAILPQYTQLYSRGLNQEQIAKELHIDQSTVSRDLHLVQQESKNRVENYMREYLMHSGWH